MRAELPRFKCAAPPASSINGGSGPRHYVQVDTDTGEAVALGHDLGHGSVMSTGGALYCLAQNGSGRHRQTVTGRSGTCGE